MEVIIDIEDLPLANRFPNSWGATKIRGNYWIIKGTYRENNQKKNIPLSRYLLDIQHSAPVRFINGIH